MASQPPRNSSAQQLPDGLARLRLAPEAANGAAQAAAAAPAPRDAVPHNWQVRPGVVTVRCIEWI